VVELAEEVSQANQRRLGWRNLARRALRFGLVPVSICCALWFSGWRQIRAVRAYQNHRSSGIFQMPVPHKARLTREQRLLFCGDPDREWVLQYRTLWEENPTNVVYYADYVTHLVESGGIHGPPVLFASREETRAKEIEAALPDLAEGRKIDPLNSRYPMLAAIFQARIASDLDDWDLRVYHDKTSKLKIKDRPAFDQAMANLVEATKLPEYRRYRYRVMQERLAVLGGPRCLVDYLRWSRMAGLTILPELARLRSTALLSVYYGRLLVAEGRADEAGPFLQLPEILARKLTGDSWFLIDYLVSQALFHIALDNVPDVLHQIGDEEQARETEARVKAILQPKEHWTRQCRGPKPDLDKLLAERAGVLATMLLSHLGALDVTDLAPRLAASRRMELAFAAELVAGAVGVLLIVAMLVSLAISLRWRWTLGRQAAPLLLLPSVRDLGRFVLLGVIAPFLVFLAWTYWFPFSGHAYNYQYAMHRIAAEFVALLTALLLLPSWLALRAFRRRCAELELPPPPSCSRFVYWLLGVASLLIVVGYAMPVGSGVAIGRTLVGIGGGIILFLLLVLVTLALVARQQYGRTFGTLSRSLISVFAVASLIMGLVVRPILVAQERRLFQADTLLAKSGPDGFSRIETELVNRLRNATLKAMAENPMPAGGER
jgi:hypothetical protein